MPVLPARITRSRGGPGHARQCTGRHAGDALGEQRKGGGRIAGTVSGIGGIRTDQLRALIM